MVVEMVLVVGGIVVVLVRKSEASDEIGGC